MFPYLRGGEHQGTFDGFSWYYLPKRIEARRALSIFVELQSQAVRQRPLARENRLFAALASFLLVFNPRSALLPSPALHTSSGVSTRLADVQMGTGPTLLSRLSAPLTKAVGSLLAQDDDDEFTGLHRCAAVDNAVQAAVLLKCGANADAKRPCGTALHVAAEANAVATVELLLEGGAKQLRDSEGQLPLHAAAAAGADECIDLLVEAGSELDAIDDFGFSALHWACVNGHAEAAFMLVEAGADGNMIVRGLTPMALASTFGHVEVVAALLHAGIRDVEFGADASQPVSALEMARERGRKDIVALLYGFAEQQGMELAIEEKLAAPVHSTASRQIDVQEVDADVLARNRSCWDNAFVTSTPLIVRGAARELAETLPKSPAELRRLWGKHRFRTYFSPDASFQRPVVNDKGERRLFYPNETYEFPFADFIDLLPTYGKDEFFSIQTDRTRCGDLEGLPTYPPLLEQLIGHTGKADDRVRRGHGLGGQWYRPLLRNGSANLWVSKPPKLSSLHFDGDDSVLLQLSGTKRLTLVSPGPLMGLTAYPQVLDQDNQYRVAPGVFRPSGESDISSWNFPAINVSAPDFTAWPLFRYAQVTTVEVHEGDALLLPAFWYHEVTSHCADGKLNVAINYWFDWDGSAGGRRSAESTSGVPPSRLQRLLLEKLYANTWKNRATAAVAKDSI